ncbi:hypothetical protein L195_g045958 [Trifolium pratense]|uniref:Uncharacterized protein n=1 Tax=Trifolium pratense TaxID=57577 RepID=A0A2K3MGC3_TRIPR|nr:hypothetical protein L195_g045958 [Trifolium pratense]
MGRWFFVILVFVALSPLFDYPSISLSIGYELLSTRLVLSPEVDISISRSFLDFGLSHLKKHHHFLLLVAGSSRYVDRFHVDRRFIRLEFLGLLACLLGFSRSWFG